MAFTTYAALTSAVRDWLGRAQDVVYLTNARIDDAVALAEIDIWTRLRVREMEAGPTLYPTTTRNVALPSTFIGARRIYLDTSPRVELEFMASPQFWTTFSTVTTGRPWAYTIEGENIVLGPAPDAVYNISMLYWARPAPLATAVNNLYLRQPDLWLYGALSHAAIFTDDMSKLAGFKAMFETAIERANLNNEKDRYGGAPLVMRVG